MLTHLFSLTMASVLALAPGRSDSTNVVRHPRPAYRSTADSIRVANEIADADYLASSGLSAEAQRRYQEIIARQVADSGYAGQAMWQLANLLYGNVEEQAAAKQLDELAESALRFDDVNMELRARLEAATLYVQLHQATRSSAHVKRIKALLESPRIDTALRTEVEQRLHGR